MDADVVTFGETMVVMSPERSGPLKHVHRFHKGVGGAESNVAVGLARLGHDAAWASRLGADPHGEFVRSFVRGEGVETLVTMDETAPTGVLFKERRGVGDPRVFYYRQDSAASRFGPEDLPAIEDAEWLHVTGIMPALSASCREATFHAVERAREAGVRVCFDPNVRESLWDDPAEMRETLLDLAGLADLVVPGVGEGATLVGEEDPAAIAKALHERGVSQVVVTQGGDGAYASDEDMGAEIPPAPVDAVVDTVGAGDGFVAGLLAGLLDGDSLDGAARQGAAVGAFAVTVDGDVEGLPTTAELSAFREGDPAGR